MAKSDVYEYKYIEILMSPDQMRAKSVSTSREWSVELLEARTALYEHIMDKLPTLLTPYAYDCLIRYFSGEPQLDIAADYGVTQPAIHKALYGCVVYTYSPPKTRGGAIPKIKKWVATDPLCIELLSKMQEMICVSTK